MSFTLRDKSGKNLGSFDLPSLLTMAKASRLNGSEEYLASDQNWKSIRTIPEMGSFFPPAKNEPAPGTAPLPDDLMNMFEGLNDDAPAGGSAQPDFSLHTTQIGAPPAAPPADPAPTPAAGSPTSSVSLDELWADDNGNMLSSENIGTPGEKPAAPNSDATVMGKPPAVENKSPSLNANTLFGAPPASPAPPTPHAPAMPAGDPLGDLLQEDAPLELDTRGSEEKSDFLQFPSAETAPKIPASKDAGLEDLFSAPAEKETKSQDSLDSILGASPDALASDLSMPSMPSAPAPKPSPPATALKKTPSPPKESPKAKSSPTPQLPTQEEKGISKVSFLDKWSDFISPLKEKFQETSKILIGVNLTLVLLAVFAALYFFAFSSKGLFGFKLGKKHASLSSTTAPNEAAPGETGSVEELMENSKKLLGRDNYGTYLQAAQIFKDLQSNSKSNPTEMLASQIEALALSQLRQKPDKAILAQLDTLTEMLRKDPSSTLSSLRAQGAAALARRDTKAARDWLAKALQTDPKDSLTLGLVATTYFFDQDLGNAENFYNQSIQANPANLHSLYGLALLAQQKTEAILFENRLKKVLELSPGHVAARVDLGSLYFSQFNPIEAERNLILITGSQSKDASGPELAIAHYHLGQILLVQGKTEEAGKHFEQAVQADLNNAKILAALGDHLLKANKIEEAKNRFMAAIQIEKKADYQVGYASALIRERKFGDAMLWLQQAIRSEPNNASAHLQLGFVQKELGNNEEALSNFRQAQRLKPKNLEATLALAEIFVSMGKLDLAINEYREGIAISPKDEQIHMALGEILFKKGNLAGAAQEFQAAIEISIDIKKKSELYKKLGDSYLADRKYPEAIEALKMSSRLVPNSIDTVLSLGIAHYKRAAYAESQETLESIRDLSPQGEIAIEWMFHLANTYLETGNYTGAIDNYKKVLAARPNFFVVHYQLGLLYMKQSVFEKALDEFELALPKLTHPDERYNTMLAIGQCYYEKGLIPKSERTYQQSVQTFPNRSEAYFRLGQLYDEQQQIKKAMSYYEKTIQLNPKDDRAHFYLAFGYKSLNQPQKAIAHFKTSLALNPVSRNTDQAKEEIEVLGRLR